jgi:hypothetical protein
MREKTLANESSILVKKSKFFLYRIVSYFSFLLIPLWIQKGLEVSLLTQSLLMFVYMGFMAGQWYFLGKEIDHRFKIYFRANSSLDRILYRLIVGSTATIIICNLIYLTPEPWTKHFFWGFWAIVGLFYSWPTRGKIIEESVSSQFTEYKFLDSFEKTVLFLTFLVIAVSIPNFRYFQSLESLKLLIDPDLKMHQQYWNYLQINYFPFKKFPNLMYLAWCLHFYMVGILFYILSFYGILRFFFSRRVSILGIFAAVSAWTFSLSLAKDPFHMLLATQSSIWVWVLLWAMRSATYRAGLMYGLYHYQLICLNYNFIFLFPISALLIYFWYFNEKNTWYKKQFFKYSIAGVILIFFALLFHIHFDWFSGQWNWMGFFNQLSNLIKRKAFLSLSVLGILSLWLIYQPKWIKSFSPVTIDKQRLNQLFVALIILIFYATYIEENILKNFGTLWILIFLSLIPIEWIFQVISRSRSKRNIIFVVYVLVCLLDSHFEGRVRIAAKFFKNNQLAEREIKPLNEIIK